MKANVHPGAASVEEKAVSSGQYGTLSGPVLLASTVALLVLFLVLLLSTLRVTSPVTDEVTEVAAGYDVLVTGDFSAAGSHPFLLQSLAALPLLTIDDLTLPDYRRPYFELDTFTEVDFWQHGIQFLAANADQVEEIVFRSRLMIVFLGVIAGLYAFRWSLELYGRWPALLALFLFVLSPNILAHAGLATLDMGFTAFVFITFYYLWRLTMKPRLLYVIATGVALGVTLASKVNAPVVIPIMALMIVVAPRADVGSWSFLGQRIERRWLRNGTSFVVSFAGILFVAWVVINAVYGLTGVMQPLGYYYPHLVNSAIGSLPVPFPEQYVAATLYQIDHATGGHAAFLFGRVSPDGWWFYHLVTFLFKEPLPVLILLAAAVVLAARYRQGRGLFSTAEYFLLIPAAAIFVVISIFSIKVGFRHILPVMPFLYVYVSKVVSYPVARKRWVTAGLVGLAVWYALSALLIYPHFLSYFNELAGGPDNGYRYLVDSNIDWGQDLKGLKAYMEAEGIDEIQLSFFGSADPAFYDIDYEYLPSVGLRPSEPDGQWWYEEGYAPDCRPRTGTIAVSVTNLQGVLLKDRDCFDWLEAYEPVDKVGYSIFIYEIESAE